ncbi:MAG: NAD-dependent epimerase/dehydratase family protein [Bacteroidetes bacterium]|nr:MAG: NAD-dependent epimerase/dehydratase family protein [Bacteroidota bacterium]
MSFTKIAVTGSTGHIGNTIVRALLGAGFEVVALYRTPKNARALDGLSCHHAQGDLLDDGFLHPHFKQVEAVIHAAGVISVNGDPHGEVWRVNVEGTRKVVEACLQNGVQKLIHFSSVHALQYDENTPLIHENLPLANASATAYDYSKSMSERVVLASVGQGLNASILNPTAVLGPYDFRGSLQGDMLRRMWTGALPALINKGFDWVDVRDVANAALLALQKARPGERYLIGGRWATPRELAEISAGFTGQKPPQIVVPIWVARLGLPFMWLYEKMTGRAPLYTGEMLRILAHANPRLSTQKARTALGYRPRQLEVSLRDTYDWMVAQGWLPGASSR